MTKHHGELAYSWPVLVLLATLPAAFVWRPLAWACVIGAFFPCCLIRDWWVRR